MSGLDKKNDESVKDIESQPLNAPKIQRPAVNNQKAISSCLLYCFCSVSMVLVNKSLASRYVRVCRLEDVFTSDRFFHSMAKNVTDIVFLLRTVIIKKSTVL